MEEPNAVPQIKYYRLPEEQTTPYDQTTPYEALDTSYNMEPDTNVTAVTKPASYLGLGIFVTLCCCWPLGCVGIVFSLCSTCNLKDGDVDGAKEAGEYARNWSLAGLTIGIVINFIILLKYWPDIVSALSAIFDDS